MSGLMKWPGSRRRKAPGEWVKHVPDDELEVLMALVDLGSLPSDAQHLYAEIRTRAGSNMAQAKAMLALPSPANVTVPPEMSFADILRIQWSNADASVRRALRKVAEALGIDVPLARTRPVGGKDSLDIRRSESTQHPNDESEPLDIPTETEPEGPGYHDPPEWHDERADGWEPCESLHDALHPEDRGWY